MFLCHVLSLDATAINMATFGQGTGPIFIDNSACAGTEPNLLACNFDPHTSDCTHAEDAGIRCNIGPRKDCTAASMDLVAVAL